MQVGKFLENTLDVITHDNDNTNLPIK